MIIDTAAYSAVSNKVSLKQGTTFTQTAVEEQNTADAAIQAKPLSNLIDEYELNQFSLIANIEGAERGLLEKEFETMVKHCLIVIMEFHRSKLDENLDLYLEQI